MDNPKQEKPLDEGVENSPRKSKSVYDIDWANNPPEVKIIASGRDITQAVEANKIERERLGLSPEDLYLRGSLDHLHQVNEWQCRTVTTVQDLLDGLSAVREQVDELQMLVRKLMRRHRRPMCQRNRRRHP